MSLMLQTGIAFAIAIIIPQAIGILGALSLLAADTTWYKSLNVAPWSPPDWVYKPVWTIIYLLIGVSSFLIWLRHSRKGIDVRPQIINYAINLLLNGFWMPLFYGLGWYNLACFDSILLLFSTIACIVSFHAVSRTACYLLLPYFVWGCIATSLNLYISIFNLDGSPFEMKAIM